MYHALSQNFFPVFYSFFTLYYVHSNSFINAYVTSLNTSEEIKHIFSHSNSSENATDTVLNEMPKMESFAEGGVINIKTQPLEHKSFGKFEGNSSTNNKNNSKYSTLAEEKPVLLPKKILNKTIEDSHKTTTLGATKLSETGSNLFLGVPEVIHINGTSSIKPRKGVQFTSLDTKIVPEKDIDSANETSSTFAPNHICFHLSKTECYNSELAHDLECNCCKDGNTLGEIFKQHAIINCKNCILLTDDKEFCKDICCNSVIHDTYSVSKNHDKVSQLRKKPKLKPSITKVPYDVGFVTEYLGKSKEKVLVPVVVSLFLMPLIGILIFFIWQRMKEYWDKRYYKRMDFLIDGIYND